MKKIIPILLLCCISIILVASCKKKDKDLSGVDVHEEENVIPFDSTQIAGFFTKYPDFKAFQPEIKELYKKHDYHYIWYDRGGLIEFAEALYDKVNQIKSEGVQSQLPYKQQINDIFYEAKEKGGPDLTSELLISSMYFFYAKNVLEGLDPKESKETGWYLPREKVSYVTYLDTLMKDPNLLKKHDSELLPLYYDLKKGLQKYTEIEEKGGWGTIEMEAGVKSLKPGDSSKTIAEVRKRLFISGDLSKDSGNSQYDDELLQALMSYKKRNSREMDNLITPDLIKHLNVPVQERIKAIVVNMERCRWISTDLTKGGEYIAVNIPSYRMRYFKDNKMRLESNVVVGKEMNKTIVFSGQMSYLVFSPYWNIPKSIIEKEIKPGMAKDKNYLANHNMEWNNGRVRQKPGNKNSLGLVKFMFPNSNNIYLHDSPAKSLFNKENRAFSHGCVRVQKARDLAVAILEDDKNWTPQKIDKAMHAGKENSYTLKKKIPVYIAYFTAFADENGMIGFFDDVYNRDARLASLLYKS
ncbi:L,D-transpeptidase family protein [Flavobacterium lindanitolerans]|uniref:Murein L,D-transpeptidase YcbB/YkuD n=1 Tax=Flavobacterium lindanitolerans TaxID=428988 RepID=A0A497UZN1_9FLAO|nr:L,D-transpeptidase family protein [Flavobacterium lindanitolerans]PKW29121.1 murein L,D-transpeptidase YcbB/YkuD [Flavobacterium lindanitolerans]RLJ35377.1 murein L,D-transpeptidase YcbB/YkuD [Flavobacterium lindanitolerans]THD31133.1 MAG: L,D-transpeptidase [Flavobacterium johnsoniae]